MVVQHVTSANRDAYKDHFLVQLSAFMTLYLLLESWIEEISVFESALLHAWKEEKSILNTIPNFIYFILLFTFQNWEWRMLFLSGV